MIVLLDTDNEKLTLYTKTGMTVVKFADVAALRRLVGDTPVTYVTKGMQTGAKEIIALVNKIRGVPVSADGITEDQLTEALYLRSTRKGVLEIPLSPKERAELGEPLQFKGPLNFRAISSLPKNLLKNNQSVRAQIEKGVLQVVSESEMRYLKDEGARLETEKKTASKVKAKRPDHLEDIIEIDLNRAGGVGGRSSNENSLVPMD